MPDYGHDLVLGTFVTPEAGVAEEVVGLAGLTEEVGLDMVTVQDHPYNAAFLDTYTLLTWIAARTSRLRVSANVTSLPLRPPAVLARVAASLDILSGGRFEMGLGAGVPIPAARMTGRRLSAGESIDALEEAIDILRGVWDVDADGPLRHQGEHYEIPQMKRGPRPAHDIAISLGAYKPRMLRLTGRKADGWLPTLDYIKEPGIAESNRLIDDAATEAGRDPRQIRRHLNLFNIGFSPVGKAFLQGPPEQWVDDLLSLVLEHGFSGFYIGGDDPDMIRTFGEEVAPALRAEVARERGTT
ncbi:LLM class flavin-dependent oxidoreductase [Sphaerisporangium aureirubrum]|uniref:LLM class flavin-dependent oxidoreductase n=1 Tax=Sphaerisporangium aureirubrum TaxID=1544736 RepID=A0ABW1NW47_9ACTN